MNFFNSFIQNIANSCGVPVESIRPEGDKIFIGSKELPLSGVFFNEDSSSNSLTEYFNTYNKTSDTEEEVIIKGQGNDILHIRRLDVLNKDIEHGIYLIEISNDNKVVIFTGNFGNSEEPPKFTSFSEVLFVISVLETLSHRVGEVSWVNILECIGPFVIYTTDSPPLFLGECGLSFFRKNTFSFKWDNISNNNLVRYRKDEIPEEAEKAYLVALQYSNTPDIAFLNLYRVLEILFAYIYKNKVKNANLIEVIDLIKSFGKFSELDALILLLDESKLDFIYFTNTDFDTLFDGYRPQEKYKKISEWLGSGSKISHPPHEIRAFIIYYVRCALVHSKLSEKDPFLIGPFSPDQEEALKRLAEDTREIIKSLLY